jgi:hypothetical protein
MHSIVFYLGINEFIIIIIIICILKFSKFMYDYQVYHCLKYFTFVNDTTLLSYMKLSYKYVWIIKIPSI